jgi:hypothetical protein
MRKQTVVISLTLAIVGFGSGYALGYSALGYALMHVGGLGSIGLLASAVGYVAQRKGHRYWPAFALAFSSSVLLGTIGAFLVPPAAGESRPAACGGSLSLIVVLAFLAVWSMRSAKVDSPQG